MTAGHEQLSFKNAYSRYNEIPMYGQDEDTCLRNRSKVIKRNAIWTINAGANYKG